MVKTALPALLQTALGGLERAYTGEGAGRHVMPSLEQWSNLLRVLGGASIDHRELPTVLRLSKRAVRSRVSAAVRAGWVGEQKFGRGPATVRLTALGFEAAARWKSLQDAAEKRWQTQIGDGRAQDLRSSLEAIVSMLPLEHPHYPASYGAADASVTGGNGQDWKAVPRTAGDTVSSLPLSALISQALVGFAMHYEEKSPAAFSLSASVIQRIPPEGRSLHGLGHPVGISALNRHGFVSMSSDDSGSKIVRLTQKGLAARYAYDERIQAVEMEWCNQFGMGGVTALRHALEAVADTADHTMETSQ